MASKGKGKVQPIASLVQGGAAWGTSHEPWTWRGHWLGMLGGDRGSGAKGLLHCLSALGPEERPAGL